MKEGHNAVLWIGDNSYNVSHYKIKEKPREEPDDFFFGTVEVKFNGELPEPEGDMAYAGRLVVNGDALWYFPWIWFKKMNGSRALLETHGGLFCPMGLSDVDEEKCEAMNLILASDVSDSMTAVVWKQLLFIFADWLKAKSIPQFQECLDLADQVEEDFDEEDSDDDEDDDFEDEDEDDFDEEENEDEDE